jgi:hypothetical protein
MKMFRNIMMATVCLYAVSAGATERTHETKVQEVHRYLEMIQGEESRLKEYLHANPHTPVRESVEAHLTFVEKQIAHVEHTHVKDCSHKGCAEKAVHHKEVHHKPVHHKAAHHHVAKHEEHHAKGHHGHHKVEHHEVKAAE